MAFERLRLQQEGREVRCIERMAHAAQHLAAILHHHIGGVLFQRLSEGIVGGQEEPGVEAGLDGRKPRHIGLPVGIVGVVHGVGTAGLIGERDRGRAVENDELVACFRDLARGERRCGRRDIEDHFHALVVEHVAREAGRDVGLVEMVGGDDLNLAAQHLAAKILHRHLGRGLAAGAGDVGIKPGHVEDAAELERRFCLRKGGACRQRQHRCEDARKYPSHEDLPANGPHSRRPQFRCRDHAGRWQQRQACGGAGGMLWLCAAGIFRKAEWSRRPCERTRACTHLVRRIDSGQVWGIPESGIHVISIETLRLWQRCRHVGTN